MKDTTRDELVEAYLKHKLTDVQMIHLENYMKSDPAFRKLVRDSEITYEYIRYKKYEQLRHQLRAFDQQQLSDAGQVKKDGLFKYGVIMIVALLVIGILYLNYHFAVNKIAQRNLVDSGIVIGDETYSMEFTKALDFSRANDFRSAELLFQQIATKVSDYTVASSWNALMCRLAREGFTDSVLKQLDQFSTSADREIMSRSLRIVSFYNSSIYHLFIFSCPHNLSPIKPRLM